MKALGHTYDQTDRLVANTLRILSIEAVQKANSGHPGLPLGTADIATVLWTRFLKHNPADPTWPNRDRFILSAGHGSALLYSLLHLSGYPLSLDELKNFRQWSSHTAGHPEYNPKLGIEVTTGPLGQGISNAAGIALAERWLAARFNRPKFPVVDHYTYALVSDGDLMEGVSHEAASLAGHLELSKLIVFYDDNHISIDGDTALSNSTDVMTRFEAYGWQTLPVDGHDMAAVDEAIQTAKASKERPTLIVCRTHIGYGSPAQDTAKAHGAPLGEEGVRTTKEHFDWPLEPSFYVPDETRERFERVKEIGQQEQAKWEDMLEGYRAMHPDLAAKWDRLNNGDLPDGWEEALPDFSEAKTMATRASSGQVLAALVPEIPHLLGGSADLTGSNKTKTGDHSEIKPGDFSGNYIHYGIREHGMGAIMNGLALHGLRPYGGTFLVFSDYMRPSIRLAAMMGLPVIYVFSHDSIGLGEDGPTHQPVEQIASLRLIPNLMLLRPADGNETAQAWKIALERKDGPTALILTRQGQPQITPIDNDSARGAYILAQANDGEPDIVLIGTGSEVSLALNAGQELAKQGVNAQVVSMPSWELFAAQSASYRQAVLPPDVPRLAIEAGATLCWPRYIGDDGAVIGLDRFGASAPYEEIFEAFGFTVENAVRKATELLSR